MGKMGKTNSLVGIKSSLKSGMQNTTHQFMFCEFLRRSGLKLTTNL